MEQPSTVSASMLPRTSQSSTNTKKWIIWPAPPRYAKWTCVSERSTTRMLASSMRSTSAMASISEQKRRGLSTYPNGRRGAHISFPVPGCLTTR